MKDITLYNANSEEPGQDITLSVKKHDKTISVSMKARLNMHDIKIAKKFLDDLLEIDQEVYDDEYVIDNEFFIYTLNVPIEEANDKDMIFEIVYNHFTKIFYGIKSANTYDTRISSMNTYYNMLFCDFEYLLTRGKIDDE